MKRHFKLIQLFWSTAIAAAMEYRLNFAFSAISSLGGLIGSLFGLSLFYRGSYQFSGWSWEQSLLLVGVFTFLEGFATTFLAGSLGKLFKHVEQGTLDFILLKPISSQFWLSTHSISIWGIPNLVFGLSVILYAGTKLGLGPIDYLAGVPPIASAIMILYSLWFVMSATSIWFTKIYNLTEVLKGLLEAGRFPMAAYPAAYQFFFTFVVPIGFITTVPTEAILGRVSAGKAGISLLVASFLFFIANRFWKFALRFYTSASS
jgi:ABC-2 type transport system permease protein